MQKPTPVTQAWTLVSHVCHAAQPVSSAQSPGSFSQVWLAALQASQTAQPVESAQ